MKNYLLLFVLFGSMPLAAYETGPANRGNFGAAQQQTVQGSGARTFSNYNNRNWSQGVQTQTVQTSMAGSTATEFEAPKTAGKQAAQTPKAATTKPVASVATQVAPTQPSSAPVAMPANMDPAAMMQQVQGMMQGMSGMMGAAGGQPATGGQGNTAAPAMPAGMPDLSALMGGAAMPTAPAATTPAKK